MKKSLFWFRNDLRLLDNAGLYESLKNNDSCVCLYIFDLSIMSKLPNDSIYFNFLFRCVKSLKEQLRSLGSDLFVLSGDPKVIIPKISEHYSISSVHVNSDYDSASTSRDSFIEKKLKSLNIEFVKSKDYVIFEKNELLISDDFITDFKSYRNEWRCNFKPFMVNEYNVSKYFQSLSKFKSEELPSCSKLGFKYVKLPASFENAIGNDQSLLDDFINKKIFNYLKHKNSPSLYINSFLSSYINFGVVNVRQIIRRCIDLKSTINSQSNSVNFFIDSLIKREFYIQLNYNFPSTTDTPFLSYFNNFKWDNNQVYFLSWCNGQTGYPLIDAIMNCLNKTGYIHYKFREIAAVFLSKYLNIDYRLGENYFAIKLIDFNPAINNGNWQFFASTSYDADSYFNLHNPEVLSEVYDKDCKFIKKYLPIFKDAPSHAIHRPHENIETLEKLGIILGKSYPARIIDVKNARESAIERYSRFFYEVNNY